MKKTLLCCALALLVLPAFAQDASMITSILEKESASYMDFSYLVASELGMDCTPFEAYAYCDRFGLFPFAKSASTPVTVTDVSHFLMSNYGIKGGLMWSATRNRRYAWKELKATGFWKSSIDPNAKLSGRDLVRAISKFFLLYPEAKLKNPPSNEVSDNFIKAILVEEEGTK